jgi:hypothetical protein
MLTTLLAICSSAQAQSFILPIESISGTDAYVVTADGERVDGQVGMTAYVNGTLRSVRIKQDDGGETFKSKELEAFAYKPTALARLGAMAEGTSSIAVSSRTDFSEVIEREYVYFEQAELPGLLSSSAMLQLVNPGFNSRVSVYHDPDAKESRSFLGIFGGGDKSYVVVKEELDTVRVKKWKYRRQFNTLFGDCSAMVDSVDGHSWRDFATHTYLYDTTCPAQ